MTTLVHAVEVNRVRYVAIEGLVLALAAAVDAGERVPIGSHPLDPVRDLLAGLRGLLVQPLPEHALQSSAGVGLELEAPAHELEQLADQLAELEQLAGIEGGTRAEGIAAAVKFIRAQATAKSA